MLAGLLGQIVSSLQQNVIHRSVPNRSNDLVCNMASMNATDQGFIKVLKVVGSLRQKLKELKDPLKLLQDNVNNMQSDLTY